MAKASNSKFPQKEFPTKSSDSPALSTGKPAPGLQELFMNGIKEIYWAENHLVQNLPKMVKAAATPALANTINEHLAITKNQVARLEQIFELMGMPPKAKKCDAMEALVKEGEGIIETTEPGTATRDAGLIMASQKVEHHEIAAYGGLATLATTLGLADVATLLEATLAEEKEADRLLTAVAENDINYMAASE